MITGAHIEVGIDGQRVQGEITGVGPEYIRVEITSPYAGMQTSLHIPMLARAQATYTDANGLSEHGIETAEGILGELFRNLRYFFEHEGALRQAYETMRHSLQEAERPFLARQVALDEEKMRLRHRVRSGEIDPATYQRLYTPVRKAIKLLDFERRQLADAFAERYLGDHLPEIPKEMLLGLLGGTVLPSRPEQP